MTAPQSATTQLLVAETITGRIKMRLPWMSMQWASPLNKIPSCQATVPIANALDDLSDQRISDPRGTLRAFLLGPWRFSLAPIYGSDVLVAGPMLPNDDLEGSKVQVQGAGIERMLDKRVLNRSAGTGRFTDPSRDVVFRTTTKAGAIYQLVQAAISGRASRSLPIVCRQVPQLVGLETFTWPGYDLTKAWKAIEELVAASDDAPDVRLEPYLIEDSDGRRLVWDLQIGGPYFPASGVTGPDGTPLPWTYPQGQAKVTRTVDPAGMATTYFAAGEGQDRSKAIARADTTRLTSLGFPDLEEVDAAGAGGGNEIETVQSRADGLAEAHGVPTDTWKAEVPVARGLGIGAVRRGDVVRLEVRDKLYVEGGYYDRRITEVSGTAGARTATLTCDHEDNLTGAG